MEAPKKTGFWTQHTDPNSGRTYYYNMALGRSYWELSADLHAHVKKPTLDSLREWDPEAAERKYGAANQQAGGEDEELRRKREEALAKSRTEAAEAQAASTRLSLEERMALAAQKRKAAEVQNSNRVTLSSSNAEGSSEYLQLVRQLQQNDDGEDGAGGKWLVR